MNHTRFINVMEKALRSAFLDNKSALVVGIACFLAVTLLLLMKIIPAMQSVYESIWGQLLLIA